MRKFNPLAIAATTVGLLLLAAPLRAQAQISAQGRFLEAANTPAGSRILTSPGGSLAIEARAPRGDSHRLQFDLLATTRAGVAAWLPGVPADGLLPTDVGSIVTLNASESLSIGTRVTVLDLAGTTQFESQVRGLSGAQLSPDGTHLGYRSAEGLVVLDLRSLERTVHADLSPFALGSGGRLAGARPGTNVVTASDAGGRELSLRVAGTPRKLAFAAGGSALLVLDSESLWRVDLVTGELRLAFAAPAGSDLRDLEVRAGEARLGLHTRVGERSTGTLLQLTAAGALPLLSSSSQLPPSPSLAGSTHPSAGLPWPLAPNTHHPIGNSYGEYQNYGGSPYMHPGIDVLGGDGQAVFAVAPGVVKAILTTSGSYHWRVAIGASPGAATTTGYLYAHLDQPTISVNLGDSVAQGQYLGDLVPWPVAGFTHCHFARIEDSGAVWSGDWLCTDNPHLDLENAGDVTAPVFENAVGTDLFAFCANESSSYQDPDNLSGAVDIIAHVSDELASTWRCAVKELRYTIHPAGSPGAPVVNDKLAVRFDMQLDTYQNGPIDPFLVDLLYKQDATCSTFGDYNNREFFHILTNSDGNQVYEASDLAEAWDTSLLPDGDYVIRVTASDPAGNSTTAAMTVSTNNLP